MLKAKDYLNYQVRGQINGILDNREKFYDLLNQRVTDEYKMDGFGTTGGAME